MKNFKTSQKWNFIKSNQKNHPWAVAELFRRRFFLPPTRKSVIENKPHKNFMTKGMTEKKRNIVKNLSQTLNLILCKAATEVIPLPLFTFVKERYKHPTL